eukprot:1350880-Prymnesium_polylepis.1
MFLRWNLVVDDLDGCEFVIEVGLTSESTAARDGGWGKEWALLNGAERAAACVLELDTEEKWKTRDLEYEDNQLPE